MAAFYQENMREIDVCLSPEMIGLYELEESIVVVTDILRATSCMVTGLAHGIEHIVPVATVEECRTLGQQGYLMAGERSGIKIADFDMGNSPFSYQNPDLQDKKVAVTTTNGTRAISLSVRAKQVVIGAFLNLTAVCDYLKSRSENVLIVCFWLERQSKLRRHFVCRSHCKAIKRANYSGL